MHKIKRQELWQRSKETSHQSSKSQYPLPMQPVFWYNLVLSLPNYTTVASQLICKWNIKRGLSHAALCTGKQPSQACCWEVPRGPQASSLSLPGAPQSGWQSPFGAGSAAPGTCWQIWNIWERGRFPLLFPSPCLDDRSASIITSGRVTGGVYSFRRQARCSLCVCLYFQKWQCFVLVGRSSIHCTPIPKLKTLPVNDTRVTWWIQHSGLHLRIAPS